MAIRALDYTPATDLAFGDVLSALITSDLEIRPDDSRYGIRTALRTAFADFGIAPSSRHGAGDQQGRWEPPDGTMRYDGLHREGLQSDRDEMFRFVWENRAALGLCEPAQTVVGAVRPCLRVDGDGFTLRETVADYVQMLTVRAGELASIPTPKGRMRAPKGLAPGKTVRLLGGGALVFDEFGALKYHIRNSLLNARKQTARLRYLYDTGFFDGRGRAGLGALHVRALRPDLPACTREPDRWR